MTTTQWIKFLAAIAFLLFIHAVAFTNITTLILFAITIGVLAILIPNQKDIDYDH